MTPVLLMGDPGELSLFQEKLSDDERWQFSRLPWDNYRAGDLDERSERLVVAVPSFASKGAEIFLGAVAQRAIRQSVLLLVRWEEAARLNNALQGADDFATWLPSAAELHHRLERLSQTDAPDPRAVAAALTEELALTQLVGCDPRFLDAVRQIPRFGRSGLPVLIVGETGTGKELCARAVHFVSVRRNAPFVAVDCGAIPEHLFENELFGHERGAYTDARAEQKGLVGLAEGGTLFLDEVDALSFPAQGKLLRFLQEKTYRPLGSEKFLRAHVCVLAASNRDLEDLVLRKEFRPDLYYRLNVLQIRVPPLRNRSADVSLLARHFLDATCTPGGRKRFSPPALQKLAGYDWPGNVRELYNVVQRAAVFADGGTILPAHITLPNERRQTESNGREEDFRGARTRMLETFERNYVLEALARNSGNITRAAREAGAERRAFGRLVKKYGLNRSLQTWET